MKKFVYLIEDETGRVKIGFAKNLTQRLKQHKTSNPEKLIIIAYYSTYYYSQIETALKRKYSYLKCEGEWFTLTLKNKKDFLMFCKQIEDNIIYLENNSTIDNLFF